MRSTPQYVAPQNRDPGKRLPLRGSRHNRMIVRGGVKGSTGCCARRVPVQARTDVHERSPLQTGKSSLGLADLSNAREPICLPVLMSTIASQNRTLCEPCDSSPHDPTFTKHSYVHLSQIYEGFPKPPPTEQMIGAKETSDHLPTSKLSRDRPAGSECRQLPEMRKHHQTLVGSSGPF